MFFSWCQIVLYLEDEEIAEAGELYLEGFDAAVAGVRAVVRTTFGYPVRNGIGTVLLFVLFAVLGWQKLARRRRKSGAMTKPGLPAGLAVRPRPETCAANAEYAGHRSLVLTVARVPPRSLFCRV